MASSPKPRRKRRIAGIVVSLLFFFLLIAGAGALYLWNGLQPTKKGEPVRIEIPSGTGTIRIAEILEEKGIIRSKEIFTAYLKYKGEGSRFQAGTYDVTPGSTIDEVIAKLNAGETVKAEMIRFTIPEGYTVKQIADKLAEAGYVKADEFLSLEKQAQKFAQNLPAGAEVTGDQLAYNLEGYLFPETYEMKKGSTAEEILERMTKETADKLATIPNLNEQLKSRKMTLHQLLTVASLVEKEAAVPAERPLIAGVIYNRLKADMKLEIDATVQYALGETKDRLFEKDLQVDSPYNTYRNKGLPPGPIASPGLASIQAALEPKASEYLFYVTKKDGSREHLFAKTYAEHLKNIEASKKEASK
ncbi:endolytic transglycosylase MltG [Gorillibacterium timonense]|uniref:endolytic transglycosylase MltG n=1 Tax=Gorillibacterium timonense TaxID=1689269 RepID=UPI00071DDF83|nr:endolytic transglycosylase MltG [Gorillibacterium timonense]